MFRKARTALRLVADADYRKGAWAQFSPAKKLFQPFGFTGPDRYPHLFAIAAQALKDRPAPRLLSFGCSTGEEVFTLRGYFPDAVIVGIDINRRSIAAAKRALRRRPDPKIGFVVAGDAAAEPPDSYDAVFCLAVLRHGGLVGRPTESCAAFIRFADFEAVVAGLARCLRPGGLLFIENSHFRFSDTASYRLFEVIYAESEREPAPDNAVYDRDNRRLAGEVYGEIAFRKRL